SWPKFCVSVHRGSSTPTSIGPVRNWSGNTPTRPWPPWSWPWLSHPCGSKAVTSVSGPWNTRSCCPPCSGGTVVPWWPCANSCVWVLPKDSRPCARGFVVPVLDASGGEGAQGECSSPRGRGGTSTATPGLNMPVIFLLSFAVIILVAVLGEIAIALTLSALFVAGFFGGSLMLVGLTWVYLRHTYNVLLGGHTPKEPLPRAHEDPAHLCYHGGPAWTDLRTVVGTTWRVCALWALA